MDYYSSFTVIPRATHSVLTPLVGCLLMLPSVVPAGALHDAVRSNDMAVVEALLTGGVEIDETDYALGTALHVAVSEGNEEMVKTLIRHGADVDAVSELQDSRALHFAAEFGTPSMLVLLLDSGATIDMSNDVQRTPLMVASVVGNVEAVRLLLARGAEIETREARQGVTPLLAASLHGHLEVVRLLVEGGANLHATDREGRTALREAATPISFKQVGGPELMEYLASKGADMNAREDSGFSILEFAENRSTGGDLYWADIIETLQRLGATK